MKKILLIGAAILGLAFSTSAQVAHKSVKFIPSDLASITISNTFMLTNLSTAWNGAGVTNMTGITITNQYGVRTIVVGAATGNTRNLLQDVPLWSLRDGNPAIYQSGYSNSIIGTTPLSLIDLAVKWTTGSGTDQAVTFTFTPMYGANEATISGEEWAVAFTPTVSSTQVQRTNVPVWKWPGASGLRLRRVTFADTTAAATLTLQDISLNGYVPQ